MSTDRSNSPASNVAASRRFSRLPLGVAAVVTAVGSLAPAAVVAHSVNITLNATNFDDYNLDVDQDGTTDFTIQTAYVPDPVLTVGFDTLNFPFASTNAGLIDGNTGDGFPSVSLLAPGAVISNASLFSGPNDQGNLYSFDSLDGETGDYGSKSGFVGLRFTGVGGTYYGYAQVTGFDENSATPFNLTIGTVAYDTTAGQSIAAGAVPEPASIGLLAAGAAAMFGRRKIARSTKV